MIVPGPVRRRNEIAFEHGKAFAFDDGISVGRALDDEADRRRRVAVRRRDFAGFHQLHRDMHGVGHAGGESGIAHLNRAPPRFAGGNQLAGPIERLQNLVALP